MLDTRPSKKQRELLTFIANFIKEHGYGPSYREIMSALDYKSVSTVAVHVDGLVARGMLRKTDHSARSLEVVSQITSPNAIDTHLDWLKNEIKKRQETGSVEEAALLKKALDILARE
ncbi:MAG TPA: hypothetical protein VFT59_05650 [Candidatus Saccharimonadales bacterium]|nr:hypothetical protein [Candidatus Saccharimonadales bacterium]